MIVKSQQSQTRPVTLTRAEIRESLVELFAAVFERELRADLSAEAEATGEPARLRAIHSAPVCDLDADHHGGA